MLPSSPEALKISLTSPFICLVTVPDASSAPPGPPDLLNRRLPPLVDRDRAFPGGSAMPQMTNRVTSRSDTAVGEKASDGHRKKTWKVGSFF